MAARKKNLVQLQDRFWAMSCSAAYELDEWHGKSLSRFIKLHRSLPRRSPDHALGPSSGISFGNAAPSRRVMARRDEEARTDGAARQPYRSGPRRPREASVHHF